MNNKVPNYIKEYLEVAAECTKIVSTSLAIYPLKNPLKEYTWNLIV